MRGVITERALVSEPSFLAGKTFGFCGFESTFLNLYVVRL